MIAGASAIAVAVAVAIGVSSDDTVAVIDHDPIDALTVIPIPRSVDTGTGTGHFHLTDDTRIVVTDESRAEGERLAASLRPASGLPLTVTDAERRSGDVALFITDDTDPAEAYRLRIDDTGALVTATAPAGLFYGSQTLRQLLPAEIEGSELVDPPDGGWRLPMVTVRDAPRYEWRGAMLDLARHFFDVTTIAAYIDQLAAYKINRLHLHLTDDQGWRIELPSWPDLTGIGGQTDIDGGAGGWLSADDYRRITDYAARRHITVVPEVDMPGHVNAALASVGALNPSGRPSTIGGATAYGQSSLSAELPATAPFIMSVFTELAAMTPGPYIHLGGDEAFATSPEDYASMVRLAIAAIREAGKIPVGWEEIVDADIDGPYVAQHWLDPLKAVRAARSGAQVIMSPAAHAYLDQKYDTQTALGLDWAGHIEVDTAYRWDPLDAGVEPEAIIGVEAPLWSETVSTPDDIEYLAFPRVIGLAEIGWSGTADRTLDDYLRRLGAHGPRLAAQGIDFHRSPLVDWGPT